MGMKHLVLHWFLTLPVIASTLFCTGFTLRAYTDDWLMLTLLLPGCLLLWGCVALVVLGLCNRTEFMVVVHEHD